MNTGFLHSNLTRTLLQWLTSLGIVHKPAWLHQHPRYQWNFSFFRTDLLTHLAPFHPLETCLRFMLLSPLLVVVYQIQPSNVVELQQHSSLSNNSSVTTYVHRIAISPPCCLNKWRTIHVLLNFSSVFWIIHNKNCISFSISLRRNNVSKSVYINLRHSLCNMFLFRIQISILLNT